MAMQPRPMLRLLHVVPGRRARHLQWHGWRGAAAATAARVPQEADVQAQWGSMQTFFESAHFTSKQHCIDSSLEALLLQQGTARGVLDSTPRRAELDAELAWTEPLDPVELMYRWARHPEDTRLSREAVVSLLNSVHKVLLEKSRPLLDLDLPSRGQDPKFVIVGDTHGQLLDVLHIFHTHGPPSDSCVYLFNGDVADRGPQAVEILILVLGFKLRHPDHIHFIRGNHENREVNERPRDWGGGFAEECTAKYGTHVYDMFHQLIFPLLPLFAVVQQKVFVVHGGLFRTPGVTLPRLRQLTSWQQHYPMPPTVEEEDAGAVVNWSEDEAILFDALWGDPHPMKGFRPSRRGPHVLDFGRDVTSTFLEENGLSVCIRSHECPRSGRGFAFTHASQVLTVFSASNYGGMMANRGVVALLRHEAAAPSDSSAVQSRVYDGVHLQLVDHEISLSSPYASSPVFKQAMIAQKHSAMSCPVQAALGILLVNRDELIQRCRRVDDGLGYVSKARFVEELAQVATDADVEWECLLDSCLRLGPLVEYADALGAVHAKWMHSTAEQAARLASTLLAAEIPLEELAGLLGCTCSSAAHRAEGETCTLSEIHTMVQFVAPDISEGQLEELSRLLLGTEMAGATPDEFVFRLLLFAPPFSPREAWMQEALPALASRLRDWAGVINNFAAARQLFQLHADQNGKLTLQALESTFTEALLSATGERPGGLEPLVSAGGVDAAGLRMLLESITASDSGSATGMVTLFQLLRALGPTPGLHCSPELLAMATRYGDHRHSYEGAADFLFLHRGSLLRGCRLLDIDASGLLEPAVFLQVAEAVAVAAGSPLSADHLTRIGDMLGARPVPYPQALGRFRILFDGEALASRRCS